MTTPERLRRRQYIESALLIAIGVAMLVQQLYFQSAADGQRECLANNFQELSVALDKRSELVDQETEQNRALWGIYAEAAGIVKDDPTKPLSKKDQDRLNTELVKQLLEYQRVMAHIKSEREKNPLPPYPEGACTR